MGNLLYRNNGDGTFTNVAVQAGVDDRRDSNGGVGWADYDNDSDLDLYVGNRFEPNARFVAMAVLNPNKNKNQISLSLADSSGTAVAKIDLEQPLPAMGQMIAYSTCLSCYDDEEA